MPVTIIICLTKWLKFLSIYDINILQKVVFTYKILKRFLSCILKTHRFILALPVIP